jgi:tyrosine-protein kinase Etk/Wzc
VFACQNDVTIPFLKPHHASDEVNHHCPLPYESGVKAPLEQGGVDDRCRLHCNAVPSKSPMNQLIQQVPPSIDQDDAIDMRKYLGVLFDNRWLITGVVLVAIALGVAYALIAKPIYEANILIQVEDSSGANAGSGVGSTRNIQGDLSSAFDIKTVTASEIEVLRSRAVVSRAVDNARLYISVKPKYFPGIGAWVARNNKQQLSEPGLFGYGGYVWGAEQVDVSLFNVPEELEGKTFVLTAEGNNSFRLSHDGQGGDVKGQVGQTVTAPSANGVVKLRVEHLEAKPGAQFFLKRAARLETIERLQNALNIQEKGKQSGIIGVTLDGPDPKSTSTILNEIGREYIRQNLERKSGKAQKSLAFLDRQLPELKQELERSENKYKVLRYNHASVDLGEQARSMLQQSVWTQTKVAELQQRRVELLSRYQNEHPAVVTINRQMSELNRQLAGVDAKIKELPAVEQELVRLSRDVKVNTELYTSLLSTAQQLRLATSSELGNARLLDSAEIPVKPIKPKPAMAIALAALIGIVLGVAAAFVRKTLRGGIDNPHDIKHLLGIPVSATIPHSVSQEHLYAQIQSRTKAVSVLAHNAPSDNAIESLRSFRASLQYTMRDSKNNIIVITSPTPGVGKTFVSVNFAAVLASIGKKVLLIDGDLRKGYLHRYFGLEREHGLSDAIAEESMLDRVIYKDVVENVDFISTGNLPPKPAELLAHENFGRLLEALSARYDLVLIDTAPVLAVADALAIAPHAGSVFGIVRGGVSTVGEIDETVKRLNQAGATVTGAIFNDLRPGATRYGYEAAYGKFHYVGYSK